MSCYIELDNLPKTSNYLLNILWKQNHEMTLDELTDAINKNASPHWEKIDVKRFLAQLVTADYVITRRHGFTLYYAALGTDAERE